jgi:lysylphosphatidylglycerol synthetase-like protein (DUF2156 family)
MIAGFPLIFFLPLILHVLAGLTTVVIGSVAFRLPKRAGAHHQWGQRYLWAYTLVLLTAAMLSVQRWEADAYLFFLAVLGSLCALVGYSARRFRHTALLRHILGDWWVVVHLALLIASYVVLLTAFYVDNAHLIPLLDRLPSLTFWVLPSLISLPFIVISLARFAPKKVAPSATSKTRRNEESL